MAYNYERDKKVEHKLFPEPIENITDWGKGIRFKADDGHEYATFEEANRASKLYWAEIEKPNNGRHR